MTTPEERSQFLGRLAAIEMALGRLIADNVTDDSAFQDLLTFEVTVLSEFPEELRSQVNDEFRTAFRASIGHILKVANRTSDA